MTDLRCPRCRSTMQRCAEIVGVLGGCPVCGGLFIDDQAGTAVMNDALSPGARAFIQAHDEGHFPSSGAASAYRGQDAREAAVCPLCDHVMRVQHVEGVDIDLCDAHGTFFDHRELKAFMFARAEGNAHRQTQANRQAAATERQAEGFHHAVREPSELVKRKAPVFVLMRELLHRLQLFIRR